MNNNVNVKKIYDKTFPVFIEGFSEEEIEKMKQEYFAYLSRSYSKNLDTDDMCDYYVSLELVKLKKRSKEDKIRLVTYDECLEKIKSISLEAQRAATSFVKDSNIVFDVQVANKKIEELKSLLDGVKPFNRFLAENYVSEGILDFEYASKQNTLMSLRTGRFVR